MTELSSGTPSESCPTAATIIASVIQARVPEMIRVKQLVAARL